MRFIIRVIRIFVECVMYIYCKIVYRIKVIGRKNIPKEGALIFCGNHRSLLDPPLIVITASRNDIHFIAKQELKKGPFIFLGKVFEVIFVKRDAKDIASLKESLRYLKNNECIGLFPEGTRNGIEKGEKLKNGVAYFALNSDAKIIPVGIKGGEKPFKKATITFGEPMEFNEEKKNKKDKEVMEKVTDKIMNRILELAK